MSAHPDALAGLDYRALAKAHILVATKHLLPQRKLEPQTTAVSVADIDVATVELHGVLHNGKAKEDYKTIGTFLVFTAGKKENLFNSEYCKASRVVGDIAIGRYEQTLKRGYSMKM